MDTAEEIDGQLGDVLVKAEADIKREIKQGLFCSYSTEKNSFRLNCSQLNKKQRNKLHFCVNHKTTDNTLICLNSVRGIF